MPSKLAKFIKPGDLIDMGRGPERVIFQGPGFMLPGGLTEIFTNKNQRCGHRVKANAPIEVANGEQ